MSWEEEETSQTVCPCGNGRITQKHYSDDWGRFEDGPVVIECEDCNKKYKVKEEQHYGRLTSDGSWSKCFLLPIDFPAYDGPSEVATYGELTNQYYNFTGWLIEHFTESELREVEKQLHEVNASSRLTGDAAIICKEHKSVLKTVRISSILASVEKAMTEYPNYIGNKQQREEVRRKEKAAKANYSVRESKKLIPIKFD